MDRFAEILYDLGKELDTDLYPDENRICQLNYNDELSIQILFEEPKEELLIATFLTDVPPGKYREKLLKAGLVHNAEEERIGTFGYSERNNKLAFFTYVPIKGLRSDALHNELLTFIDEGLKWKKAVESGGALPTRASKGPPDQTIFGLKP